MNAIPKQVEPQPQSDFEPAELEVEKLRSALESIERIAVLAPSDWQARIIHACREVLNI